MAFASVAALRKELFPADGLPTHPISRSRVVLMFALAQKQSDEYQKVWSSQKKQRGEGGDEQ